MVKSIETKAKGIKTKKIKSLWEGVESYLEMENCILLEFSDCLNCR